MPSLFINQRHKTYQYGLKQYQYGQKCYLSVLNKSPSNFSTMLHPWFVTGLIDGDGTFSINVVASNSILCGYQCTLRMAIEIYNSKANREQQDKQVKFWGIKTKVKVNSRGYLTQDVRNMKDQIKIREHFDNYPLQSTKNLHYILWCNVMDIIQARNHTNIEGVKEIILIKSMFPKGLNDTLSNLVEGMNQPTKPVFIPSDKEQDPNWIAGFTTADGSFTLNYKKDSGMKLGYTCQPNMTIAQHIRDLDQLKKIQGIQGKGSIYTNNKDVCIQTISGLDNQINIIVPLYIKAPLHGDKQQNFKDWVKGLYMIKNKEHLTLEGLNKQKDLAHNMNSRRITDK